MKADLSPTARALRALELLQAQPGITGGQLAAQLEVTERAVRRARPRGRPPGHADDERPG